MAHAFRSSLSEKLIHRPIISSGVRALLIGKVCARAQTAGSDRLPQTRVPTMRPTKRSQRDLQELEDLVPKQARSDETGEVPNFWFGQRGVRGCGLK